MPAYVGFQLALELSNAFPLIQATLPRLIEFARDLRKSGSDIVVEGDLAEIFGRGNIEASLENWFKDEVKVHKIVPLMHGSDIELHSGPGPTVLNAFQNRKYMSTVIQLSFLSRMHGREQLATMIATAMRERFAAGLPGADTDPGYEGIMGTLTACSTQTAAFDWSILSAKVETKLRSLIPTFQYSPDYVRMTPALLGGAMDFLYLVQSLPEDRKVVVSNEVGSVSFIIWAHFILGLSVHVIAPDERVLPFGDPDIAQVTIFWSKWNVEDAGDLFYPTESDGPEPEIRLLQKDEAVVLKCVPDDESRIEIQADDRHVILGWGTVYLNRWLNTALITKPNDPIYKEAIHLSTAFAIHCIGRLERCMNSPNQRGVYSAKLDVSSRLPNLYKLETWRILRAANTLFHNSEFDEEGIQSYVDYLSTAALTEANLPVTFTSFLKRIPQGTSSLSPAHRFLRSVLFLAQIILLTGHISNLDECVNVPIRLIDDLPHLAQQMTIISKDGTSKASVEAQEPFHAFASLLSGAFDARDDMPKFSSRGTHYLFLCSDFGWSVFLDTVGDKDPGSCRPELIHVKQGTPFNSKTKERKLLLRDGSGFSKTEYPDSYPLFRGITYAPRAAAIVSRRSELWASRRLEFESTLYFKIQPSPEWAAEEVRSLYASPGSTLPGERVSTFEILGGYRAFQNCLWQCYQTPDDGCAHTSQCTVPETVKLGPDAVTLLGFSSAMEVAITVPQRVLIFLTRDEPRLRWLAVRQHYRGLFDSTSKTREMMIRRSNYCDECALSYTAALPGRWILVL